MPGADRAVLFDVDGTLLDVWPRYLTAYRIAAAGLGLAPPEDRRIRILKRAGLSGPQILARLYPRCTDDELRRLDQMRLAGSAAPEASRLDRAVPGARSTLAALRAASVPFALVTFRAARHNGALKDLQVLEDGDVVLNVTSGEKSAGLLVAAEQLGAAPPTCLVVGDTPVDVRAAHRAGMVAVAVTHGLVGRSPLARSGPAHLVPGLADVLTLAGVPETTADT